MKKFLRSQKFTAVCVDLLTTLMVFNGMWIATKKDALEILLVSAFAGFMASVGYLALTDEKSYGTPKR